MGFSHTVYVGPFVRCTYHIVEKHESVRTCDNHKCPRHGFRSSDAFCSSCGGPITSVDVPIKEPSISRWQALNDAGFPDNLFECHGEGCDDEAQEHWFIPNINREQPRDFSVRRDSSVGILATFAINDMEREISWLNFAFAQELSALEKAYDKIEVTWGIIHYAI